MDIWASQIEFTIGDTVVASSTDELEVTGGDVAISGRRKIRRTLRNLTILDRTGDGVLTELLSVRSGAEIRPSVTWRDVRHPLGVFRPDTVRREQVAGGVLHTVTQAYDRAWSVDRAGFETPLTIASGLDPADAIAVIVDQSLGFEVPRVLSSAGETTARATWTSRPWTDAVVEYAQGAGLDARFDASGQLVVTPIDTDHTITATIDAAGTLIAPTGEERGSEWGNGVTMIGTSPHLLFGVRSTVWDDDPTSPTYYLGPTGRHLVTRENATIFSTTAAETAARAELARLAGGSVAVSWSQVPEPSLDAFDVIGLTSPGLGITGRVVLDELTIPLRPGPMSAVGRTV